MDQRVKHVVGLMRNDLRQDLTLSEMARAVHVSPGHLCRLFKAETGGTPASYLKRFRLQKAQELLEGTFLSVKEIMNTVGIKDESHFVRDFERFSGLTPSRYRALNRSGAGE